MKRKRGPQGEVASEKTHEKTTEEVADNKAVPRAVTPLELFQWLCPEQFDDYGTPLLDSYFATVLDATPSLSDNQQTFLAAPKVPKQEQQRSCADDYLGSREKADESSDSEDPDDSIQPSGSCS